MYNGEVCPREGTKKIIIIIMDFCCPLSLRVWIVLRLGRKYLFSVWFGHPFNCCCGLMTIEMK